MVALKLLLITSLTAFLSCNKEGNKTPMNKLANSTSPYLLQHAHNPVEWYPWGEEALNRAKKEQKPIIVSIGYSACHWCHVMERECFENEFLANLMNKNFINIKVDREERPDVDNIYMEAVQAMGLRGGWPLNVFLTPDQKPFYGGTYFPPEQWKKVLTNVVDAFQKHPDKLQESAEELAKSIARSDTERYGIGYRKDSAQKEDLKQIFGGLKKEFDLEKGGSDRAPKFPTPCKYRYLLRYFSVTKDEEAKKQIILTLDKMAQGGIYDQIGGGFARYSVDDEWFCPHFEKMLYDNAQMLSLYAEAYQLFDKQEYKQIIEGIVDFIDREMRSSENAFYASLDADSEGVEGKFYVWTWAELESILSDNDMAWFSKFYNLNPQGNWEEGVNILHRTMSAEEFSQQNNMDFQEFNKKLETTKAKLLHERSKRIRPGVDDKILAGWNGLMLSGLCDAYDATGSKKAIQMAKENGNFIINKIIKNEMLFRTYKNGIATIPAFLDDYAAIMEGFIRLYECTFEEKWINQAATLANYCINNFYDEKDFFFYYSDKHAEALIARKKEIFDNVIPSSNSMMTINLHKLGLIMGNKEFTKVSDDISVRMNNLLLSNPSSLSNWATSHLIKTESTAEIAIVGNEVSSFRSSIAHTFHPNRVMMGCRKESKLPLLTNKTAMEGNTTIYICFDHVCKQPTGSIKEAIKQLSIQ